MGSTITGLTVGLGPDGELRYPSHHQLAKYMRGRGAGEFQCYDKNMLHHLKSHAEKNGTPLWGLGGPHDAPSYDESPLSRGFFAENGGSWENQYGDFFRDLSLAASTFRDEPITVSGKLPLLGSWSKARSHPSELTAGFYNTDKRDGYDAIVEMFSRNSCLPGLDLSDEEQPKESLSSPESLLGAMKSSCVKHKIAVSGQNSMVCGAWRSFQQIKKNLEGGKGVVNLFSYQRMGADFFSPQHFPSFSQFVRRLKEPARSADDSPVQEDEETAECQLQMQTA